MTPKILRKNEVLKLVGLSPSTLLRLEKRGHFPSRRIIGLRAIGWIEKEILDWISELNQRVQVSSKERASDGVGMIKSRPVSGTVEGNHE